MKIHYDAAEDVLHIQLCPAPIVRDVSHGWNVHLGYAQTGLAEVTILEAKAAGDWLPADVLELLYQLQPPGDDADGPEPSPGTQNCKPGVRTLFKHSLMLYFAPLAGAYKGAITEMRRTERQIARERNASATKQEESTHPVFSQNNLHDKSLILAMDRVGQSIKWLRNAAAVLLVMELIIFFKVFYGS